MARIDRPGATTIPFPQREDRETRGKEPGEHPSSGEGLALLFLGPIDEPDTTATPREERPPIET